MLQPIVLANTEYKQRTCKICHPHYNRGTRWRSWLRYCATSRKVAGSILDVVTGIFHLHNPSGRIMVPGWLREMSTGNIWWRPVRRVDNLTTFMCRLSRNSGSLNLLQPSGPVQACNMIPLRLHYNRWWAACISYLRGGGWNYPVSLCREETTRYRVTQKNRNFWKTQQKLKKSKKRKFIDRTWTITTCLLRDSNQNYRCLKITSCRWRPPPRMHSFTATTHFKSSRSFLSPCVCCMLCRMR